ncbi:MAG: glycosyltransferase [Saprospiraceae bacterium]
MLARNRPPRNDFYKTTAELPFVSVVMSLYNEEAVIQQKLASLQNLDYPQERLHFFIGSDCSADRTNEIVSAQAEDQTQFHFFAFRERRGKPAVINDLVKKAKENYSKKSNSQEKSFADKSVPHILLVTDANVMLEPETLRNLVRHFKNEKIVIVDANMLNEGLREQGISRSENRYLSGEVQLKYNEGLVWGKMIGPFGGCYAIRADWFSPVPLQNLVDDFYICMRVLERNGLTINDLDAVCYEAATHRIEDEYKRKTRISAGNYQNLSTFHNLWLPPFKIVDFAFLSHKVLRWWGIFFMVISMIASGILAYAGSPIYTIIFGAWLFFFVGIPTVDFILKKLNIHIPLLRNLSYFVWMNIALGQGFFRYLKGIEKGTWEPTVRAE